MCAMPRPIGKIEKLRKEIHDRVGQDYTPEKDRSQTTRYELKKESRGKNPGSAPKKMYIGDTVY